MDEIDNTILWSVLCLIVLHNNILPNLANLLDYKTFSQTLIPDIKPLQEAVVELHPNEGRLSGDEDSSGPREREEPEEDQGLKIRRTVTQVSMTKACDW